MRPVFSRNDYYLRCAFALLTALCMGAAATADDLIPYEARIATPGAPVQSGPGENFYPTDTLAQGDVVEVYREQPGGWLGIRPPEGSFSWLFGRHVKLLEGGLAEVDKDDVPSRIGSRLGDERNAVQVRLKRGEVVEVLSKEVVDGETWYKIAPPSGEFRWIHARHLGRRASLSIGAPAEATESAVPPIVTVPASTDVAARADTNVTLAADAQTAAEEAHQNWRASPIVPAATAAPNIRSTESAPQATAAPRTSSSQPTPSTTAAPAVATPQPSAIIVDDGLARRVTDLELRLSRIVAEPPVTWQIGPLRAEAQQLFAQAANAPERAAVGATIAKLDRFASIAGRYQQAAAGAGSGDPRTTGLAMGADGQRYDAVGILRPVVSKRAGAPQFALVDERGQVVSFVTPTPDLNLQPFLGHRIGITGSRGYIPEFQRAHVTAGRVSPLGERMLR